MPPSRRSDMAALRQEARAMEIFAEEIEVPVESLQAYWEVSADLITLVAEIDEYELTHPDASYEEPEMLQFRRRIRDVAGRLGGLAED